VEQAQRRRREAEERRMREDEELAAAQLIEEELAQKAEESQRRERLDKAEQKYKVEKKQREMEKVKGNKRKVDEDDETDEGSVKKRKEVSNKVYIFKHTNECIAEPGGGKDHHSHGGPLPAVCGHPGHLLQEDTGSWLLGVQQVQDEVQRSCASGGHKEWRMERRRVRGAATTDNNDR